LLHHIKKDSAAAAELYMRILAIEPTDVEVLLTFGRLLCDKKDYAGAEAKYQEALSVDPHNLFSLQEYSAMLVCAMPLNFNNASKARQMLNTLSSLITEDGNTLALVNKMIEEIDNFEKASPEKFRLFKKAELRKQSSSAAVPQEESKASGAAAAAAKQAEEKADANARELLALLELDRDDGKLGGKVAVGGKQKGKAKKGTSPPSAHKAAPPGLSLPLAATAAISVKGVAIEQREQIDRQLNDFEQFLSESDGYYLTHPCILCTLTTTNFCIISGWKVLVNRVTSHEPGTQYLIRNKSAPT